MLLKAAEFRALWGKRCELRRFRDGTVCEAVVWAETTAPLSSRRLITRQMVLSLLQERLGIAESAVTYLADQLEPLLANKTVRIKKLVLYLCWLSGFLQC